MIEQTEPRVTRLPAPVQCIACGRLATWEVDGTSTCDRDVASVIEWRTEVRSTVDSTDAEQPTTVKACQEASGDAQEVEKGLRGDSLVAGQRRAAPGPSDPSARMAEGGRVSRISTAPEAGDRPVNVSPHGPEAGHGTAGGV